MTFKQVYFVCLSQGSEHVNKVFTRETDLHIIKTTLWTRDLSPDKRSGWRRSCCYRARAYKWRPCSARTGVNTVVSWQVLSRRLLVRYIYTKHVTVHTTVGSVFSNRVKPRKTGNDLFLVHFGHVASVNDHLYKHIYRYCEKSTCKNTLLLVARDKVRGQTVIVIKRLYDMGQRSQSRQDKGRVVRGQGRWLVTRGDEACDSISWVPQFGRLSVKMNTVFKMKDKFSSVKRMLHPATRTRGSE